MSKTFVHDPNKVTRISYDTPLQDVLSYLLLSSFQFSPNNFSSVVFFDNMGHLSDIEATRFWYDLHFTIENMKECYRLFKIPITWRCMLYIGFSNNYYVNYHYILSANDKSFLNLILHDNHPYDFAIYQKHMPYLQTVLSDPSEERVRQLLQLFIIPFCDYYRQRYPLASEEDDHDQMCIRLCIENHSIAPRVKYKGNTLSVPSFQEVMNHVNVYTLDSSIPSLRSGYMDTIDYLYQNDIIEENVMEMLKNDSNLEERRAWFQSEYGYDQIVAPKANISLHEWYNILFAGYYNLRPLQVTRENFHHIFNLYKSICVSTFKKDVFKADPTLENLMDIFEGTRNKHSYLQDMNFFDVMFLRPFLQWKCRENIPSYVANIFKEGTYDTDMEEYDLEKISLRYSLLKMHFHAGLQVGTRDEHTMIRTEFRNRAHIASVLAQMTKLISTHKQDFDLYADYATDMEIEPSTSFQTVMERFREDEDQIIEVTLYEYILGKKVLKSHGVGLAKQWLTEHYTSKNVLSLLKDGTDISMRTILNFGYKHKFGLVIHEDLFEYLVYLHNKEKEKENANVKANVNDQTFVFRYEHAEGFLWYLLTDAKEYNIDLFLESAMNTDYKEYCEGTLREEESNPREIKSYVQEDYELNFEEMKEFVDTYLSSDLPVDDHFNLTSLNTELDVNKIPYFSKVTRTNEKYMRSVYEHFIHVTYDANELKSVFSQDEPDATLKVVTALESFNEAELQDFVMTVTSLRRFPAYIKVTTYEHNDTDADADANADANANANTQHMGFQFHTCTNHVEFPRMILTYSDEQFAQHLKQSLMTRFTMLGGKDDESMDVHYLVSLARALLLTLVLGATLHLVKDECKRDTRRHIDMIMGMCIFILYTVVLFLQYNDRVGWILVHTMDVIAIVFILRVLWQNRQKNKNHENFTRAIING